MYKTDFSKTKTLSDIKKVMSTELNQRKYGFGCRSFSELPTMCRAGCQRRAAKSVD